jgi:hypothetical protein
MKATNKGILARITGRRNKPVDTAPVIVGEVPVAELLVEETDEFTLLKVAIDRADRIDVKASTRQAAVVGMDVLSQADHNRMRMLIRLSGAMTGEALRNVIMELAGIGRAHMANEAAGV